MANIIRPTDSHAHKFLPLHVDNAKAKAAPGGEAIASTKRRRDGEGLDGEVRGARCEV